MRHLREDSARNRSERDNLIHTAEFDRFFRHAEHDTAGFILRDGISAGLLHRQQTLGPVSSHTCEDDAYGIASGILSDGMEHDVHRRPVAIHRRILVDPYRISCTASYKRHVVVARSDERMAGKDAVSVLGFFD